MIRAAIDPGAAGGIAYLILNQVYAKNLPTNISNLSDMIKGLSPGVFYVEDVGGHVKGNNAQSSATFARHCGHLDMAIIAHNSGLVRVKPKEWQEFLLGKPSYPKIPKEIQGKQRAKILSDRKRARKNLIKQLMQERYPHLKVTLKTADALGILTFAMEEL